MTRPDAMRKTPTHGHVTATTTTTTTTTLTVTNMGYTDNPEVLRARLDMFDKLPTKQTISWTLRDPQSGDARRFAYKLREGLAIARANPLDFPELAALADHYTFRVQDASTIIGDYSERATLPIADSMQHGAADVPVVLGTQNLTLDAPRSVFDVITFWVDSQNKLPHSNKLRITNHQLSEVDMGKVYRWASGLTPPWIIVRPKDSKSFTLGPYEVDAPAWSPDQ